MATDPPLKSRRNHHVLNNDCPPILSQKPSPVFSQSVLSPAHFMGKGPEVHAVSVAGMGLEPRCSDSHPELLPPKRGEGSR